MKGLCPKPLLDGGRHLERPQVGVAFRQSDVTVCLRNRQKSRLVARDRLGQTHLDVTVQFRTTGIRELHGPLLLKEFRRSLAAQVAIREGVFPVVEESLQRVHKAGLEV